MKRIIIDTDLRSDCDDAGALALAHVLANQGRCILLGAIASTSGPHVVAAIDAINHFFGRPEIPIGLSPIHDTTGDDDYAPWLAANFPHTRENSTAPDSTLLYRRLLADAADASVTLIVIGAQGPLQLLLDSPADLEGDQSIGKTGEELIRQKVAETVIMAGNFADPEQVEWNVKLHVPSAQEVAKRWPGPTVYVDVEIGAPVLTGGTLSSPETNPIAKVYELYPNTEGGRGVIGARCSWDLIAVHYAVQGESPDGQPIWGLSEPGRVGFTDEGKTTFVPDHGGNRRYLVRKMPDQDVSRLLDTYLSATAPTPAV